MHNYESGSFFGSGSSNPSGEPDEHRGRSFFSLIVMIAVVAVGAVLVLGTAFWVLGLLFHMAGWILRVALLAAVAAFVWKRITRGRSHHV
jgi:hypothetical protein